MVVDVVDDERDVRWVVHGERPLYESRWVRLVLADVELPDGQRFEHHVVRMQRVAAAVVLSEAGDKVLLLRRHRFITDTWGWEVPAGIVEPGEEAAATAVREVEEETGWRVTDVESLISFQPAAGIADTPHDVFVTHRATQVGDPTDVTEAQRVEWVPLAAVTAMMSRGEIVDALTMVSLLYVLAQRSASNYAARQ